MALLTRTGAAHAIAFSCVMASACIYRASFEASSRGDGGGSDASAAAEAGTDAGMSPADGAADSNSDSDAGPDVSESSLLSQPKEICTDAEDNDNDGKNNCEDPDCARLAYCCDAQTCCSVGKQLISESWSQPRLAAWSASTATEPAHGGGWVYDFGYGTGLRFSDCVPMEGGFHAHFYVKRAPCISGAVCTESQMSLVLGADASVNKSSNLVAAARLEFRADGRVRFFRNGVVRSDSSSRLAENVETEFHLRVTPDVRGDSEVLVAELIGADGRSWLSDLEVLDLRDMQRGATCPQGGMFVGVEGVDSYVQLGKAELFVGECALPGRFVRTSHPALDYQTLGFDGSWAAGGVGSPSALAVRTGPAPRIELFVDSALKPRGEDLIKRVRFRVGRALSELEDREAWTPAFTTADLIGCSDDSACDARDTNCREPSFVARGKSDDPVIAAGVYAFERCEGSDDVYARRSNYELRFVTGPLPGSDESQNVLSPIPSLTLVPGFGAVRDCASLRSPQLLARAASPESPGDQGGYTLIFRCDLLGEASRPKCGGRSEIRKLTLNGDLSLRNAGRSASLVSSGSLGESAAFGICSGVVAVDNPAAPSEARLWFIAAGSDGALTLNLAKLSGAELSSDFVLYGGNPVLTASDLPECDDRCALESVSALASEDGSMLEFFVAYRDIDGNQRITSFEQPWGQPW